MGQKVLYYFVYQPSSTMTPNTIILDTVYWGALFLFETASMVCLQVGKCLYMWDLSFENQEATKSISTKNQSQSSEHPLELDNNYGKSGGFSKV
jgi:hypothetical protein